MEECALATCLSGRREIAGQSFSCSTGVPSWNSRVLQGIMFETFPGQKETVPNALPEE